MRELYLPGQTLINDEDEVSFVGFLGAREVAELALDHDGTYECVEHDIEYCDDCIERAGVTVRYVRWRKTPRGIEDWAQPGSLCFEGQGDAYPITLIDDGHYLLRCAFGYF